MAWYNFTQSVHELSYAFNSGAYKKSPGIPELLSVCIYLTFLVTTQQFTRNLNHWLSIHFVQISVQAKQKSRQYCERLQYLTPS